MYPCMFIDQIIAFCIGGSNKVYFSRAKEGTFIKSYTIAEEVGKDQ